LIFNAASLTWKREFGHPSPTFNNRRLYLNGEPVLKVQHARLTNVFQLGTSLTNLTLLEPHLGSRAPSEHCEGPGADLALLAVLLLGHPDVGVVPQAGLAQDGEVSILPVLTIVSVGGLGGSHRKRLCKSEKANIQH
jgi:hypothetical protein